MLRKMILLTVVVSLVMLMAGTCWAEKHEKVLAVTSTQQVIDQLFAGRTLDPIEGIWVRDEGCVIAMVKASLINTKDPKYQGSDYFGILLSGNNAGGIYVWLKKTGYSFAYSHTVDDANRGTWKLLTPTLLQNDGLMASWNINGSLTYSAQSFVRTYPTP